MNDEIGNTTRSHPPALKSNGVPSGKSLYRRPTIRRLNLAQHTVNSANAYINQSEIRYYTPQS